MTEVYSWWDPVTRSRERNVGWRIDAWWGCSQALEKTSHIEYLPLQMGSDHCPILIDLE
jgi:exodeoxyribonuclease-3